MEVRITISKLASIIADAIVKQLVERLSDSEFVIKRDYGEILPHQEPIVDKELLSKRDDEQEIIIQTDD